MLTADDVRTRRFPSSKFRQPGYDVRQVDDLLDRVTAGLEYYEAAGAGGKPIGSEDLRLVRFQVTKYRQGYQMDAVDTFLAEIERALVVLERASTAGGR